MSSSVTSASKMRHVMLVLAAASVLVVMSAFTAAPTMAKGKGRRKGHKD